MRLGYAIETGQDLSGFYSKTYGPGDTIPNYTLYPNDGSYGGAPLTPAGNPSVVSQPTSIGSLLQPNMGACEWSACAGNTGPTFDFNGYGISTAIGVGAPGASGSVRLGNCGN